MSAILTKSLEDAIHEDVQSHLAWHGGMSGLSAEKRLRGCKAPYLYLLRAGEMDQGGQKDYYVSYIQEDMTVKHQPFTITETLEGWYCENGGVVGPCLHTSINDVLPLIMHCQEKEITPLPCFGK
jgi:hypothetical protein